LKINRLVSKFLLLIATFGRIRRMHMDKKPCFYHAVLAPHVRKKSVWLVCFRNRSDYTLLNVWCILGDKHFQISNRCVTRMRVLFPLVSDIADCFLRQNIKHFMTGLVIKILYIYFIFIWTTKYNLNESRPSIVM